MKHFYLLLIPCLCWLIISCASTPPAEESNFQENAVEQPIQENTVESVAVEEQDISENNSLSTEDSLPPMLDETTEEVSSLLQQDENQEYLQEIEVIDLLEEDDTISTEDNLTSDENNLAVIIDTESALVVEAPNLTDEEIPPPEPIEIIEDDKALIVEDPDATNEDVSVLEEEEDVITEAEPLPETDDSDEVIPETQDEAIANIDEEPKDESQETIIENLEPVDVNAIQTVLQDSVTPSRSVVMDKNQYLDIRYPGTGWDYLGEVTKDGESVRNSHMTYFGRRRTSEDTSFTMRSSKPGTTILHFFKQDVLSATFIDDFLEVEITDKESSNGFRVIAPSYEEIVPGYQDDIPRPQDFEQSEMSLSDTSSVESQEAPQMEKEVGTSVPQQVPASPATQQTIPLAEPQQPSTSATSQRVDTPSRTQEPAVATTSQTQLPSDSTLSQGASTVVPPTQSTRVDSAPVIVPPRTEANSTNTQEYRPVEPPSYQQELYEPELPSTTQTTPDGYNPQTGLSMDDLNLPWVAEELERQRTADVKVDEDKFQTEEEQTKLYAEQDALLAQAQEYFYAEDYPASLDSLNKFFNIAVKDFDAAYYLKGQVLESKSSIKNIKEAQKAYKHVIDSYPQSPFWERAKNRHTYLSRFYFDIR